MLVHTHRNGCSCRLGWRHRLFRPAAGRLAVGRLAAGLQTADHPAADHPAAGLQTADHPAADHPAADHSVVGRLVVPRPVDLGVLAPTAPSGCASAQLARAPVRLLSDSDPYYWSRLCLA